MAYVNTGIKKTNKMGVTDIYCFGLELGDVKKFTLKNGTVAVGIAIDEDRIVLENGITYNTDFIELENITSTRLAKQERELVDTIKKHLLASKKCWIDNKMKEYENHRTIVRELGEKWLDYRESKSEVDKNKGLLKKDVKDFTDEFSGRLVHIMSERWDLEENNDVVGVSVDTKVIDAQTVGVVINLRLSEEFYNLTEDRTLCYLEDEGYVPYAANTKISKCLGTKVKVTKDSKFKHVIVSMEYVIKVDKPIYKDLATTLPSVFIITDMSYFEL